MKYGIMAVGGIADSMARTVTEMINRAKAAGEDLPLEKYAVASRTLEKAQDFAEKWGFEKAYGSYEELVKDPEVEVIYVATPHSHHYECAKMCLENGKGALVEKAFTVNSKQAKELIQLSEEKNLLLAEALWTRYTPGREIIDDLLAKDLIGEVTSLTADFGFALEHVKRLTEPELAGGALLDLGIYPLSFALMVCKAPVKQVISAAVLSEKGVDMCNSMTLIFEDGVMAVLHSNMRSPMKGESVIYGKKGRMIVNGTHFIREITVENLKGEVIEHVKVPEMISGYEFEVLACMKALEEGKCECEKLPHSETLRMMELMDTMRQQWGMTLPCE